MEGFWLPAVEWKGSGCLHWNGRVLAAGIGNGRHLAVLECNGRVLAACSGIEGFILPAFE
jgi:hypothetical protein